MDIILSNKLGFLNLESLFITRLKVPIVFDAKPIDYFQ